ncbi:bifunctional hydroxymethylpyrimidine kinase/phosphomethylpyrimidine kinase [Bacteroides sp. 214]|uniref:bifunctional hydroxymethylpyrimidine kinase/phosphomethylpyrimidine kinase n=1 Tax=Bacteroides sp. 214 TaxID=2302935 RepID=UPI0013D6E47F|nr:bifunctional hydroxymethylpyrimidine kinase/phosphomethylpyrimidine kinase [Bacteroides sp. 214]
MKRYPIVFTIAGSDCIGGNGAQADIKTISALGAYAASAITALTIGNTTGLKSLFPIPQETIRKQIETVMEDIIPDIVKVGLLNDIETIQTVGDCLRKYHPKYVVYDPVMLSDEGIRLILNKNMSIIRKEMLPYTSLLIINRQEAELFCELQIKDIEDMRKAAERFARRNRITVLIKSGDLYEDVVYDVLRTPNGDERVFKDTVIQTHNSHGASCTFSAAIATYLALEYNMGEAVLAAREFVRDSIMYGHNVFIGHGKGPVCQTFDPQKMIIR